MKHSRRHNQAALDSEHSTETSGLFERVRGLNDPEFISIFSQLRHEHKRREALRHESLPGPDSTVRIISGDSRHIGKTGTVLILRRKRAFVRLLDSQVTLYILVSHLEKVIQ